MPVTTDLVTVKCPQCRQSLPGAAMRCHFCGADLSRMARPAAAVAQVQARKAAKSTAPDWREVAFYILAGLWILNAGLEIAQGSGLIPQFMSTFGIGEVLVVMGVVDIIIGIGMWVQNDLAMYLVKYRCIVGLLGGLLGIVMAFGYPTNTGMFWATLIGNVLYLAFTGFQIYIVSMFSD